MPRRPRCCPGGTVFHVLNRSVARLTLFEKLEDYQAFYQVLAEAWLDTPIRILDWCLMPNHWHFVVWPQTDAQT
jgi:putative transposase